RPSVDVTERASVPKCFPKRQRETFRDTRPGGAAGVRACVTFCFAFRLREAFLGRSFPWLQRPCGVKGAGEGASENASHGGNEKHFVGASSPAAALPRGPSLFVSLGRDGKHFETPARLAARSDWPAGTGPRAGGMPCSAVAPAGSP